MGSEVFEVTDSLLDFATQWLRDALDYTGGDCLITIEAQAQMRDQGIILAEVRHFLMRAKVVSADRDSSAGQWVVEGLDCDGRRMLAELEIRSEEMRIDLVSIQRE
ncbi:MAG: hypothetical protein MJA83_17065 [Gammaproteobacteria bacterium]|nr:hypothetical protein [Gammaproteobacteria bacterium]